MYMDVLNESLGAENGSKSCPESETFLPAHQLIQVKGGCENGSAVLIPQCNYTIIVDYSLGLRQNWHMGCKDTAYSNNAVATTLDMMEAGVAILVVLAPAHHGEAAPPLKQPGRWHLKGCVFCKGVVH